MANNTYAPLVPTGLNVYDFERGIGDSINGTMHTYLNTAYRRVDVPLLTGVMSIKLANTGAPMQFICTLNNSGIEDPGEGDDNTTADEKFDELKLLEGSIGTLHKDDRTCTEAQLKRVTLTSRLRSNTAYPIEADVHYTIIASIEFEKLDDGAPEEP